MTRLSPHAKASLDALSEKHRAFVIAKATIEAELKEELAERLSSFRLERDTALRLAEEAGVPRTQLGKAIGTSNYRTVQEILQATEGISRTAGDENGKWSVVRLPNGNWNLSVFEIGVGNVSGSAEVVLTDDDIVFVSGDEFVVPQIFRNGFFDEVLSSR